MRHTHTQKEEKGAFFFVVALLRFSSHIKKLFVAKSNFDASSRLFPCVENLLLLARRPKRAFSKVCL